MATAVYALCALAAIGCAILLGESFLRTRARLLFWALLCFIGLALNNVVLFIDKVVVPGVDLSNWRNVPALVGFIALAVGLVWETGARR
jgi:hypothetical protein